VIYDEHYWGRNIDVARLPQGTQAICGKPPYRSDWAGGLDPSFAGMILLGLHSKDGTPGGLLPHTYEHDIADLVLNGVSIGEIGMEAAIAGDFGVPVVMITGDSAGVAEAASLLPGIQTVTTKESLGETGAVCLPLAEVTQEIQQTAAQVAAHPPQVKPYSIGNRADHEDSFPIFAHRIHAFGGEGESVIDQVVDLAPLFQRRVNCALAEIFIGHISLAEKYVKAGLRELLGSCYSGIADAGESHRGAFFTQLFDDRPADTI
jgi:hypothetical protein